MPEIPPKVLGRVTQGVVDATPEALTHLKSSPFMSRMAPATRKAFDNYEASPQFVVGSMPFQDIKELVAMPPSSVAETTAAKFKWQFNRMEAKDFPSIILEPDPDRPWVVKATMEEGLKHTLFIDDVAQDLRKGKNIKSQVPIVMRYKDPKIQFNSDYQVPAYMAIDVDGYETLIPFPTTSKLAKNGHAAMPKIDNKTFQDALLYQTPDEDNFKVVRDNLFDPNRWVKWSKSVMKDPDVAYKFFDTWGYNSIHNSVLKDTPTDLLDTQKVLKDQRKQIKGTLQWYDLVDSSVGLNTLDNIKSIYTVRDLFKGQKLSKKQEKELAAILDKPLVWKRVDRSGTRDETGDLAVFNNPFELGAHFGTFLTIEHILKGMSKNGISGYGPDSMFIEYALKKFRAAIPDEKKPLAQKILGQMRSANQPRTTPEGYVHEPSSGSGPMSVDSVLDRFEQEGILNLSLEERAQLNSEIRYLKYVAPNLTEEWVVPIVNKPLYLVDNNFHPENVAKQLIEMPQFQKHRAWLNDLVQRGTSSGSGGPGRAEATRNLQAMIEEAGYDHVIYYNRAEHPGQPSIIVWDKSKLYRIVQKESIPENWGNFVLSSALLSALAGKGYSEVAGEQLEDGSN